MSHAASTPAIQINGSGYSNFPVPRRTPSYLSQSNATPMAIPNTRESAPPPLPPPRHIDGLNNGGRDLGSVWGSLHESPDARRSSLASVKPGSSLLGGAAPPMLAAGRQAADEAERVAASEHSPSRRGSTMSGVMSLGSESAPPDAMDTGDDPRRPSIAGHRLQSETKLGIDSHQNSSAAYDQQLLSKIGGPSAAGGRRPSAPFLSVAERAASPSSPNNVGKLNGQLKPLAVPERRFSAIDSPSSRGWPPSVPSSAAVSPGFTGFRSPIYEHSESSFNRRQGSISGFNDGRSQGSNEDQSMFMDSDFMEENGNSMRDLQIQDRSPAGSEGDYHSNPNHESAGATAKTLAGCKRRSPPTEAVRSDRPLSGGNDLYHRRSSQMLANRDSPIHRFHERNHHGSLSSAASSAGRGSLGSSWALSAASTATSYTDRLSPGAMSPAVESEFGPPSPFSHGRSLNTSPRGSISKGLMPRESESHHTRTLSQDTASSPHSRQDSATKIQGLFICDCCPKKPKKFETAEELRIHQSEKQYQCQYCTNRFKNKNEAERHQNSLHLRRHSWSCAALAGSHAAFHPSSSNPQTHDSCGYCGEEFSNSPADWKARSDHLNIVHKFGECNQAKKFFRADHFRQHLKHSHAGASGKWTNMLENACMKDEPPAQPINPPSGERTPSLSGPSGPPTSAQ